MKSLFFLGLGSFTLVCAQTSIPVVELQSSTDEISTDASLGENSYFVLLRADPLAVAVANAQASGTPMTDDAQRAYTAQLQAAQTALMEQIAALGGREISRASKAVNTLAIAVDASLLPAVSKLSGIRSIQLIGTFSTLQSADAAPAIATTDYKEVVPWSGADQLRANGITGVGTSVAVLDSGIDYTHAAFGGAGTAAAYLAAWGSSAGDPANTTAVAWPQGNVVGGYDFVGETWPNGPLAPDPDPIGAPPPTNSLGVTGTDGNHGTSVADIIAGNPFPARPDNYGLAPGASLYAIKVCSAVSSSCSGLAIVQGFDFALDPDGDGSISDRVDVINLSLGANYGLKENPSTEAATNASKVGVIVVASAGNSGDNPYIVGSPSSSPETISVAQMSRPISRVFRLNYSSPTGTIVVANTNTVDWAPVSGAVTAPVAQPVVGGPVLQLLCATGAPGSLAGQIALIDRGTCSISFKIAYAQAAGAIGAILVNNAAGDPPTFSYGGIPADLPPSFIITIPVLVLSQADGTTLKNLVRTGTPVSATISEAEFTSIASTIVSSSSRGPSIDFQSIKPEIGATGQNPAALSASGTGFGIFGGTSGAAPVIAGMAALLRQQHPGLSPLEVKARLMNSAEIITYQNPVTLPGELTPVSRTGAGEARILAASSLTSAAWVTAPPGAAASPALSFGYWRLSGLQSFGKIVRLKNYSASSRTFALSSIVRQNPGLAGAVAINYPASVTVAANATADIPVTLSVDPAKLPSWTMNSGIQGANGPLLATLEYAGFLSLSDGTDTLRVPYHILPHRAHRSMVNASSYTLGAPAPLATNSPSSITSVASTFALTGTSPRLPAATYPATTDSFAITDLQHVGARLVNLGTLTVPDLALQFALTTYDRRAHANRPARFSINLDLDQNGAVDWILYNTAANATTGDWRNVTFLQGASWTRAFGTFYSAADLNSANVILTVPLSRIGLPVPASPPQTVTTAPLPATPLATTATFNFTVFVDDISLSGNLMDAIGPMTYTVGLPRYVLNGGLGAVSIPSGGSVPLNITATGNPGSASQSGLLLLFDNARTNAEARAIPVNP